MDSAAPASKVPLNALVEASIARPYTLDGVKDDRSKPTDRKAEAIEGSKEGKKSERHGEAMGGTGSGGLTAAWVWASRKLESPELRQAAPMTYSGNEAALADTQSLYALRSTGVSVVAHSCKNLEAFGFLFTNPHTLPAGPLQHEWSRSQ